MCSVYFCLPFSVNEIQFNSRLGNLWHSIPSSGVCSDNCSSALNGPLLQFPVSISCRLPSLECLSLRNGICSFLNRGGCVNGPTRCFLTWMHATLLINVFSCCCSFSSDILEFMIHILNIVIVYLSDLNILAYTYDCTRLLQCSSCCSVVKLVLL